jgi:peroxiredoxin
MQKLGLDQALRAGMAVLTLALVGVVAATLREHNVQPGDSAPDFSITTESGKKMTRSQFGGKVLVLNFWATWCPPCIAEIPALNAMSKELAPNGIVVLAISVDKDKAAYDRFLKRVKLQFEVARDPEAGISTEYGTSKYPETYVIDRKGKVIEKFISDQPWMDPSLLERLRGYAR